MNACRMVLQVKYLSDLTHNAGTRLPFSTFDENNDTGKETTYSGQTKIQTDTYDPYEKKSPQYITE